VWLAVVWLVHTRNEPSSSILRVAKICRPAILSNLQQI
jgi:hypothetical protein